MVNGWIDGWTDGCLGRHHHALLTNKQTNKSPAHQNVDVVLEPRKEGKCIQSKFSLVSDQTNVETGFPEASNGIGPERAVVVTLNDLLKRALIETSLHV